MNKLLLCAYHLHKLRPALGTVVVHYLTDKPDKFTEMEVRRVLSPWSSWVRLETHWMRQNWQGLHKTDIFLDNDVLLYAHEGQDPRPLLTEASRLRLRHVQVNKDDWLACVLDKA